MKKIFFMASAMFCAHLGFAQTVPADSAKYHENELVTICGKVTGTHVTSGEKKATLLNFGKPFPDVSFTVFIPDSVSSKYKQAPSEHFKEKNICVKGKVIMYKEKPEIIITSPEQIVEK